MQKVQYHLSDISWYLVLQVPTTPDIFNMLQKIFSVSSPTLSCKILRTDLLNAVYFKRNLTCTQSWVNQQFIYTVAN